MSRLPFKLYAYLAFIRRLVRSKHAACSANQIALPDCALVVMCFCTETETRFFLFLMYYFLLDSCS